MAQPRPSSTLLISKTWTVAFPKMSKHVGDDDEFVKGRVTPPVCSLMFSILLFFICSFLCLVCKHVKKKKTYNTEYLRRDIHVTLTTLISIVRSWPSTLISKALSSLVPPPAFSPFLSLFSPRWKQQKQLSLL